MGLLARQPLDLLGRVTQTRGPDDFITTVDYDANGNVTKYERYDVDGLGSIPTDPRSLTASRHRTTEYLYDVLDRQTQMIDANGKSSYVSYDAAGRVLTRTDELNHVTTNAYDGAGRLTSVTSPDPDGAGSLTSPVTSYEYDAAGNITKITDPRSYATTFAYDARNQLVARTNAKDDTARWIFNPSGQAVVTIDEADHDTVSILDAIGRTTQVVYTDPDGNGPLAPPSVQMAYDAAGNIVTSTDALGATTGYQYDALNRLTQQTDPDPDGAGVLSAPVTAFTYENNNLIRITDPLNRETTYGYDTSGRRTSETLPDPDGAGSLTSPVTSYVFNSLGELTSVTDANNRTTTFEYDVLGRQTKMTAPDPDGVGAQTPSVTGWAYDDVGNVVSETDPLGFVTTFDYDNLNRLISQTLPDPDGVGSLTSPVTQFTYDASSNLLTRVDPVGNTTTYAYDQLNRVLTETNELSQTRTYSYDAIGNTLSITDRNGRVREFSYDGLNRRLEERWMDGSTAIKTFAYTYDDKGRLLTAGDGNSSYTYTYDQLDRVATISNAGSAGIPTVVLTHEYDAASQRTGVAATVGGTADFTNTYEYDAAGRVTGIAQAGVSGGHTAASKLVNYAYNALGQVTSIERYTDLAGTNAAPETVFGYDEANRLTSLMHGQGSTTIAAYTWGYDDNGRITSVTSPDGSATYTYDNNGQLNVVDNSVQYDEYYFYDENGNRTNGYVTGDDNRLTDDGTYTYTYDAEGNRTRRTDIASGDYTDYTWDHRNRLIAIQSRLADDTLVKNLAYEYDVYDRRIAKKIDWDLNGTFETQERFVYDGDDIALVFGGYNDLQKRYLHGPGVDEVLVEEDASTGTRLWMLADNLGSVKDVVSDAGTVLNHIFYNAFGAPAQQSDWNYSPRYAFAGREFDVETFQYYNRARYYDMYAGRFLSQDPIGFGGGDDNLYRYAGNAPSMFTDPNGLTTVSRQPESYGLAHPTVQREYRPGIGLQTTRQEPGGPKIVEIDSRWKPSPSPAPQPPAAPPAPLPGGGGSDGGGGGGSSSVGGGGAPSPLKTGGGGGGGGGGGYEGTSDWWIINFIKALPKAYLDTAVSGEQFDSMAGYTDTLQQKLLLGYKPLPLDQFVDHWDAYQGGAQVGNTTGNAMNAIMTVAGVRTMITGIQAIQGAGGLVRVGMMPTTTGQLVPVIIANGQAIPATLQTLQAAGLTGAAALNVLNQTQSSSGGTSPASSSSPSTSSSQLTDGMTIKTNRALDEAEKFLGPGTKIWEMEDLFRRMVLVKFVWGMAISWAATEADRT